MPRPDVSAMSLDHLLDEYPRVYRDAGRRIARAAAALYVDHGSDCRGPDGCICGLLDLERAIAKLGEAQP